MSSDATGRVTATQIVAAPAVAGAVGNRAHAIHGGNGATLVPSMDKGTAADLQAIALDDGRSHAHRP